MKADFSRVTLTMTTAEFKTMHNLYDFFDSYKRNVMDDATIFADFIDAFGYGDINKVNRDLDRIGICITINDEKGV